MLELVGLITKNYIKIEILFCLSKIYPENRRNLSLFLSTIVNERVRGLLKTLKRRFSREKSRKANTEAPLCKIFCTDFWYPI